ncbi:CocE/NonD family hydrolase [Streptomyces sp. NPDC005805]|uniref:CocE/NonD family hydrolase n=1 Tax=Streptomyces sp. NPDC005805 TaxID=3157068 RepID=UPI0033F1207C
MRIRTDLPYETAHEDLRIPLPDGTRLHARLWRPVSGEPVPALLEYLPDRLTDRTAPRDSRRHPWYAGHGYASVRVDARGHGNSEGLPGGPYDERELADGVAVVEWLAARPWCTGRVGMFGIGRGGGDALRIAARAPGPLKAVVAVCAPDDRYDNNVHYLGGSVLATGTHARSAAALALVVRPPDPLHAGEGWREQWLERLEAVEPPVRTWLAHQLRDDYWRGDDGCDGDGRGDDGCDGDGRGDDGRGDDGRSGGVREDRSAIRAAVLAVGGRHDPYRDTVLRLVEQLPADRVRGLIGPWSHQYPDRDLPSGPAIGFLQETLRWWDRHLKDADNDVMDEPLLRSWISASHRPPAACPDPPGRWVGDPAWPSPYVTPVAYALAGDPVLVRSPQRTGLDAGRFLPRGEDADLPPDQREEDARSASFEFPVAGAPVEILGRPRVTLRLRAEAPRGQVAARLCDVAPDGSSTLVTRGVLNLSARRGPDRAVPWPPGESEEVTFELAGAGYAFPPGHRIRLAVSSAYWPWIWPQPDAGGFTLDPAGSRLELPVRDAAAHPEDAGIRFEEPEQSEPVQVTVPATLDEPRPERLVVRDVAAGTWRLEADPHLGTRVHPDGLEFTEDAVETYTIQEDDPLSAHARADWTVRLHRPELAWDVRITTRSELSCDAADFVTADEVVCRDGDEVVFHRTWERRIPRTAG